MRAFTCMLISLISLTACERPASNPSPSQTATQPAPLTISGRTPFGISQRETVDLPGSDGRYRITIDDITRGQVMVSVASADGTPAISPTSMGQADTIQLTVGEVGYVLILDALHNELIGDDHAEFAIIPLSLYSPMADPAPLESTEPATETEIIEALILNVRMMPNGTVFVRNGTEHTPEEAADHMERKWKNAGSRVKTAEDFIKYCASESSLSGEPYVIRFMPGGEAKAGDFLMKALKKVRENNE